MPDEKNDGGETGEEGRVREAPDHDDRVWQYVLVLGAGHFIQVAHHEGGQHKGKVDDHIPHQLVVRHVLGVHKHPQQVNGGNGDDRRGDFVFQRGGVHFAQPTQFFFPFGDIQLRDEVFIPGEHHHHQQPAHQRHVDQRQQGQDQIGFRDRKNVGQDVQDLLKKFDRQGNQGQ